MSYEPHYIASYEQDSGQFTYTEPFLAPEKAFPILQNAYCWRGRVKKKPGSTLLGRLRRTLTAVALPGGIEETWGGPFPHVETYNIFTLLGLPAYAQIQPETLPHSISTPFTVTIGGAINQTLTDNTGAGVLLSPPGTPIQAAFVDYNTGLLTLVFEAAAANSHATVTMGYYPGLPVMGCRQQELPTVNDENTIFFDTTYAYIFNPATNEFNEFLPLAPATWNGTDSDFFWTTNYGIKSGKDLFWVCNDNMTSVTKNPIRYTDGVTWTDFTPDVDSAADPGQLYNARIILPYKDRLVVMNTWEGVKSTGINSATNFPQRVRWSWNGDPLDTKAFISDKVGFGGWINAPTDEVIVAAEFIKDTLLVKFERSSWKLVYTGNEVLPFVFQKINTELGSESTFSTVPFDRGVFSVADVGITTDDSVNVERIDLQIPSVAFDFNNDHDGPKRVYGIRDFYNELVYWTYPSSEADATFPDNVLCYNYRNNSYATFIDSFTCYGYYQRGQDLSWNQLPYSGWNAWNKAWNSGVLQSKFPSVVAGNQQGFVSFVVQDGNNDPTRFIYSINSATQLFTSPKHNLVSGDVVTFSRITGTTVSTILENPVLLNGLSYEIYVPNNSTDTFGLVVPDPTIQPHIGPDTIYTGGGVIAKVDNFSITTKVFAPFYEGGAQCRLGYVDYLLDKTSNGEITGDVFINECNSISMTDTTTNTALLGSNIIKTRPENPVLMPMQVDQAKIWHRQFVQIIAQNFQIQLSMSVPQLISSAISSSDVVLHAMALYLSPNARLVE